MWEKAREAIRSSSESSSVYIGCDSQVFSRRGKFYSDYSTVVILHRDSRHGCKIFHNSITVPYYGEPGKNDGSMEARLLAEVGYALEAYDSIKDVIENRKLEIHLDVNPDPCYKSSKITSQAIGWIRGMGLEAKIKPDAPAASYAADQCVKRKGIYS